MMPSNEEDLREHERPAMVHDQGPVSLEVKRPFHMRETEGSLPSPATKPLDRSARWTSAAAMDEAARLTKQAGFKFVVSSMKSTACYYRLPGHCGLLRIADHSRRYNKSFVDSEPVLASISFCGLNISHADGKFAMSREQIANKTAYAIGIYMMRSETPHD